jgi:hypothetical protein
MPIKYSGPNLSVEKAPSKEHTYQADTEIPTEVHVKYSGPGLSPRKARSEPEK